MPDRQSNYVIRLRVDGSVRVGKNLDEVGDRGERAFRRVRRGAGRTNAALGLIARNARSLVPAFAAAASATSIFRNIQTFEKLDIRLRELTSSAEDYANTQEFLREKANELNIDIETLADGYARLLVLQNSGILSRDQVNQLSEGLVNAGAALGATGADIDRVLFGLSQGLSAGTLRAEELNQVTEPLPGLLQELDKAAGLSAGGFRRLVNAGEVTSELFANTLVTALESYEGAAANLDGTVSGSLARLNNAWTELARTIGESGLIDFLADLTAGLATSINVALEATTGQLAFAEATGVVEKTVFVTARAVKGAFLLLQSTILLVADSVVATVEDMFNTVRRVINILPGVEIQALQSLQNVRAALQATINDNRRAFFDEVVDFGPSEESIRAIRAQEERIQQLQRDAVQAQSEANQARVAEQRRAQAGPTKAEQETIKQLNKEREKIEQVTQALKFRNEQLLRDEQTQELYNQLKAAGVSLLSDEGMAIQNLVQEYFTLQEAEERRAELVDLIREVTEEYTDAQERYNERIADLQFLLNEGRISFEEFQTGVDLVYDELLRTSDEWLAGATRALRDYAAEAEDMATQVENVVTNAAKGLEDALVEAFTTGQFEFGKLVDSIIADIARITIRENITGPLAGGLSDILGGVFQTVFNPSTAHTGGVIGSDSLGSKTVNPLVFAGAPKFHGGGIVGSEVPIIAQRGEAVLTPGQMRLLGQGMAQAGQPAPIQINVQNNAPGAQANATASQTSSGGTQIDIIVEQIESQMTRNVARGEGLAPTLERRYGLNPAAGSYR
jgi:lambda family phage tail tape measure protein